VVNQVEESAIGSFLELVTKLNEATFKPLFIRLYDWAVIDLSEGKRECIVEAIWVLLT
jgi:U3 small nucleolar RNA-associated protein 10